METLEETYYEIRKQRSLGESLSVFFKDLGFDHFLEQDCDFQDLLKDRLIKLEELDEIVIKRTYFESLFRLKRFIEVSKYMKVITDYPKIILKDQLGYILEYEFMQAEYRDGHFILLTLVTKKKTKMTLSDIPDIKAFDYTITQLRDIFNIKEPARNWVNRWRRIVKLRILHRRM